MLCLDTWNWNLAVPLTLVSYLGGASDPSIYSRLCFVYGGFRAKVSNAPSFANLIVVCAE